MWEPATPAVGSTKKFKIRQFCILYDPNITYLDFDLLLKESVSDAEQQNRSRKQNTTGYNRPR